MNTEKVYIGEIYKVSSINYNFLFGPRINLAHEKRALMISRRNIFGMKYMQDLNTGEKYSRKLTTKLGTLYASRTSLMSFNYCTGNKQSNLPKTKVKALGNEFLLKTKEK